MGVDINNTPVLWALLSICGMEIKLHVVYKIHLIWINIKIKIINYYKYACK